MGSNLSGYAAARLPPTLLVPVPLPASWFLIYQPGRLSFNSELFLHFYLYDDELFLSFSFSIFLMSGRRPVRSFPMERGLTIKISLFFFLYFSDV